MVSYNSPDGSDHRLQRGWEILHRHVAVAASLVKRVLRGHASIHCKTHRWLINKRTTLFQSAYPDNLFLYHNNQFLEQVFAGASRNVLNETSLAFTKVNLCFAHMRPAQQLWENVAKAYNRYQIASRRKPQWKDEVTELHLHVKNDGLLQGN